MIDRYRDGHAISLMIFFQLHFQFVRIDITQTHSRYSIEFNVFFKSEDMLCLIRYKGFILIQLPICIPDPQLVWCSTNGAMDVVLALKARDMGSIPLALKASKYTCLESKWHGIDSCSR